MIVKVVPHDPSWEEMYRAESPVIAHILKDILVDIHHIGSTAVKGLSAKPIIDIMPVVTDITLVDRYDAAFEALGYECMGEFGIPGRRYLRKGGDTRTHQVHIFEKSNLWDIRRHLAVRDYLRAHPKTATEYGQLKAALADKFPDDIKGYCDGKDSFVKRLEQDALRWYQVNHGKYASRPVQPS
ncbi:MAG: GrpB family protein [Clostridiales bacterium]|jgi:GrpB-like predicted nucleotidyltransferase (UPF0157 family)|nr:GrpB family protein [Clostridiales bacterium]